MIKKNIEDLKLRVKGACERAGKKESDIMIIAVSKTYPATMVDECAQYGIANIGENRVQELTKKHSEVSRDVKWHLIGQLQTNKVKYILDKVTMIHSLDRLKLANEIQKRARNPIDVLIQINVAGEEQKNGISPDELPEFLKSISSFDKIKVKGLMNVAFLTRNEEVLRADFRVMKSLFDSLKDYNYDNLTPEYLSMGMSGDFEIAIEEGANMIRVGSLIFGRRE